MRIPPYSLLSGSCKFHFYFLGVVSWNAHLYSRHSVIRMKRKRNPIRNGIIKLCRIHINVKSRVYRNQLLTDVITCSVHLQICNQRFNHHLYGIRAIQNGQCVVRTIILNMAREKKRFWKQLPTECSRCIVYNVIVIYSPIDIKIRLLWRIFFFNKELKMNGGYIRGIKKTGYCLGCLRCKT